MFIVGILSWWYSGGLLDRFQRVRERVSSTIDYFSIDLLLRTLFAPFRQISAGRVDGPIGVKWHAFIDRLVSRCIGGIVRTGTILFGTIAIVLSVIIGLITILLWLLVPVVPFVGVILTIIGWTPWS
jgi:vacuolar-type H+-ATPase subunit I/STV1